MWLGCCWVELVPSPKSHNQLTMVAVPVEMSVNRTASGAGPPAGTARKSAIGAPGACGNTVMKSGSNLRSVPAGPLTLSVTSKRAVWLVGFW
ncbi:MAG: hypothetical protein KatS3mg102_1153 [Planctomycetota bacterium]|nr:MAG: hypothetical protein KatS3mg102_1153 [Planctomycetota bacterium]